MTQVDPAAHLQEVLSRYEDAPDERLAQLTMSAIRHLHAFVVENQLTNAEWMGIIEGLTRTGQICTDERQEFILASDTLGVSMLVEMVNHGGAEGTTEPTVFGPFHLQGAAVKDYGESIFDAEGPQGEPVLVSGVVKALDGTPIAGASLDVWQTAANGLYDVQDPGQAPMNMRGLFASRHDGSYAVSTVRAVDYRVPGDGPAGELLARNGRDNWRPAHIHFVVSAPGFKSVTTHLFDADSEQLHNDAVFGVRPSLVVDMSDGSCSYDFVLEPEG